MLAPKRLLVVLLGLASCGRFGFAPTHGQAPDAGPDPRQRHRGAWGAGTSRREAFSAAPLVELSSSQVDDNPTLTSDELVFVFSSERPGGAGHKDLWYAVRSDRGAAFSTPRPLPVVNSTEDEGEPQIHPATCELFFSSWRGSSLDIYRSRFVPN